VAERRWWEAKRTLRGPRFTDAETMRDRRAQLVWQAQQLTRLAIKRGILPHPSKFRCADCGARGYCYDHRDYRRPLWVTPLCNACNGRRPPALPWVPKQHNGNRDEDHYIHHSRPLCWDDDSDLSPVLPPLEALAAEIVHACPTCGHVVPKRERRAA
jgi:hypothetical protein